MWRCHAEADAHLLSDSVSMRSAGGSQWRGIQASPPRQSLHQYHQPQQPQQQQQVTVLENTYFTFSDVKNKAVTRIYFRGVLGDDTA